MKRIETFTLAAALGAVLLVGGSLVAAGQSTESQTAPQLSADQQEQLNQLEQLEGQLQKDREAVHAAITQYGWDSEEVDTAQEKLFSDRMEYRKLRRSLGAAGVTVPPPSGLGRGGYDGGPSGRWGRGPQGRWAHHGRGHHCRVCGCRGCGW